jgi:hypothetical protein
MKLSRKCKAYFAATAQQVNRASGLCLHIYACECGLHCGIFLLTTLPDVGLYGIITFTFMPTDPEAKRKALQASGTFNARAAQV